MSLRNGSAYFTLAAAPASSARSRRKSRNHSPASSASWLPWQNEASILRSSVSVMSTQQFGSSVPDR